MRTYFITGLPRSGTAWLANLMTDGPSYCYHEASGRIEKMADMPALFEKTGCPNVGTADCGFPYYYDQALELFPEAQIVIVERDREQCRRSYERLVGGFGIEALAAKFEEIVNRFEAMRHALQGRHVLEIEYHELNTHSCGAIWNHCTNAPGAFRRERCCQLMDMQVQVWPERVVKRINVENVRQIFKAPQPLPPIASSVPTPAMTEFNQLVSSFCVQTPGAFVWVSQLWDVLLTWDHIEDGDVIDRALAGRAFEALFFNWPNNPFWQAHAKELMPVMCAAMSAWKHPVGRSCCSATEKHYDAYTEVPCAMAFLIGGTALVHRVMPRLRELAARIKTENEKGKP